MSEERRPFVVVNPASANGRTGRRWPELAAALRSRLGKVEHAFTSAQGEASRLAREALDRGYDFIISVGGDGTHNEVINGFCDVDGATIREGAAMGVVPTGTGGDLRRTLALPKEAMPAIDALGVRLVDMDLGHVAFVDHHGRPASRYFVNICSFGISGLVDKLVNESSKALGGKASFLWGVARATIRYSNQAVRLRIDESEPRVVKVNNVAVANGQYFGGGMRIAPNAAMDDGVFDVTVVGDLGVVSMARGIGKLYRGDHIGMENIETYRATAVFAEPSDADIEVLIDVDGEQPGRLPATLTIRPAAFRMSVGLGYDTVANPASAG